MSLLSRDQEEKSLSSGRTFLPCKTKIDRDVLFNLNENALGTVFPRLSKVVKNRHNSAFCFERDELTSLKTVTKNVVRDS